MPIKILINGYQGKMGQAAVKAISACSDLQYIAGAGRADKLSAIIELHKPDVVLDLTTADAAFANTQTIIDAHVYPVIGTSGLTAEQVKLLQARCTEKKLGGIIAPNFSVGAILMMNFAVQAAQYFNEVEIIELHHTEKKDAPSGTARKTAELISAVNAKEAPIHSLRISGVVAEQSVIFGGTGETLSIRHSSIDRSCFMPGILLSCRAVVKLESLLYGLDSLIIK